MRIAATVKTDWGAPIFLRDNPCTACGCHQAFEFRCGCGEVHSDVCYNCGGFVDVKHVPIEEQNEGLSMQWSGRCTEGTKEHVHVHPFKEG